MIFKFGWREFKSEFLKHFPMIVQMALIMLITISCVTSVYSRFRYLNMFRDLWEQDGVVFFAQIMSFGQFSGTEEQTIRDNLHGVQDVELSCRYAGLQLNIDSPLIYSDRLMARTSPEMVEGKWVISATKDDLPNVMVNANSGYHTGDVIETWQIDEEYNVDEDGNLIENSAFSEDKIIRLRVAGVYPENAKLVLLNGGVVQAGYKDYRQILAEIDTVQETSAGEHPLSVVMSESEANKIFSAEQCVVSGICMITFESGLSGDEQYDNDRILNSAIQGPHLMWKNSELYAQSRAYCFRQAYALMPVLVGVLVLFLISMVSVNSVSAIRKQRTYMIYRICGLKWQRCVWISAVKAAITSCCAIVLCAGLMLVKLTTGLFENLLIEFGMLQWLFCIGFALVNIGLAVCISSAVLHRSQIRQILKES